MTAPPLLEWTEPQLQVLRSVAEAAGQAILGIYARLAAEGPAGAGVALQHKADASPLTEADLLADRTIRTQLSAHFAGLAVLSEEGDARWDDFDAAAGYFLVDPLDGTKEFLPAPRRC